MAGALETIYYNDLDYIFGQVSFLARSPAESYPYDPSSDMLTSDQWDEVRVKDAWYRDRIRNYFIACGQGGTPEGVRTCVQAAIAVDADLFEVWRYFDDWGLGSDLGRAPTSARNELVIRPHKAALAPVEARLLRDMLDRMLPIETVVTVNLQGLAVAAPVPVAAAAADSTYFEVQKSVTATPVLSLMPPPELLPVDLLPTEQWLYGAIGTPCVAPTAAFNSCQQFSEYYLAGAPHSQIDAVTYGTLQSDGSVKTEQNYSVYQNYQHYTEWRTYEKADCPENYPGGKYGLHPSYAPAYDGIDGFSWYRFPWASQHAYVEHEKARIIALGGIADDYHYRLPVVTPTQTKYTFYPEYAIADAAPPRESTVSVSPVRRRKRHPSYERRDPAIFVRA